MKEILNSKNIPIDFALEYIRKRWTEIQPYSQKINFLNDYY